MTATPLASVSLDLDNQWSYMKTHGDPAWQDPKFNQGVPIELIRGRIEAKGFGNSLGN